MAWVIVSRLVLSETIAALFNKGASRRMTCKLCNGSKVVYTTIGDYGVQTGPCPNCTDYVHKHYERELESVIDHEQRRVAPGSTGR